jgi:hypothetical protein
MLKPAHCSSPSFTRLPPGDSTSGARRAALPSARASDHHSDPHYPGAVAGSLSLGGSYRHGCAPYNRSVPGVTAVSPNKISLDRHFTSPSGATVRPMHWRKLSTTHHCDTADTSFEITHPFHPLRGQQFQLVTYRHNWGEVGSTSTMPKGAGPRFRRAGRPYCPRIRLWLWPMVGVCSATRTYSSWRS